MGIGYLKFQTRIGENTIPLQGADITVMDMDSTPIYHLITDENGETTAVSLYAPDKQNTLNPAYSGEEYSTYDVEVTKDGYRPEKIYGVQIFDTVRAVLPINMEPETDELRAENSVKETYITENALLEEAPWEQSGPAPAAPSAASSRILPDVVIPEYITVHLGAKNTAAKNVRVKFIDYIKNVVSSEIFPTWNQAAIEANTYAIISFALNRIYTEWYRSQGYDYDITSNTQTDMKYIDGRDIFENISATVDRIFNQYVRRQGTREPYFTEFCNGTTVTCPGMSQWGSQYLALSGMSPIQILRYYYPSDIEIVQSNNIAGVTGSYPGSPLSIGSRGQSVTAIQNYLNRIRKAYPLIPQVSPVDGVYGTNTANAVRTFQSIFNLPQTGVVDNATWYKISYLYASVTKLAELTSEGDKIGVGTTVPTTVVSQGSKGTDVTQLQFILNYLSNFYSVIPAVTVDGNFGAGTTAAVKAFQQEFGLTPDGTVGSTTWKALFDVYKAVQNNTPPSITPPTPTPPPPTPETPNYPGKALQWGSKGDAVATMQRYLTALSTTYPSIPKLTADGIFGQSTQTAVLAFQRLFGLTQDGIIGPATWQKIVDAYNQNGSAPAYPGYALKVGSTGDNVALVQRYLNNLTAKYPSITKIVTDGVFGNGTKAAVIAFQKIFNLTADGIVGPATWNALVNAQ
ncbi:MAG: peptidoglycan-binding protein [Oscillospiraceae bacterium]|jgi:peptidoglycan hydrolase-like protein with peptidoglycan-binding domain|nr:peptidoglycan-binding protein [Oscillospiraceae bacterium]